MDLNARHLSFLAIVADAEKRGKVRLEDVATIAGVDPGDALQLFSFLAGKKLFTSGTFVGEGSDANGTWQGSTTAEAREIALQWRQKQLSNPTPEEQRAVDDLSKTERHYILVLAGAKNGSISNKNLAKSVGCPEAEAHMLTEALANRRLVRIEGEAVILEPHGWALVPPIKGAIHREKNKREIGVIDPSRGAGGVLEGAKPQSLGVVHREHLRDDLRFSEQLSASPPPAASPPVRTVTVPAADGDWFIVTTSITQISKWGAQAYPGMIFHRSEIDRPGVTLEDLIARRLMERATPEQVHRFFEHFPVSDPEEQAHRAAMERLSSELDTRVKAATSPADKAEVCLSLIGELDAAEAKLRKLYHDPAQYAPPGGDEMEMVRRAVYHHRRMRKAYDPCRIIKERIAGLATPLMVEAEGFDFSSTPFSQFISHWGMEWNDRRDPRAEEAEEFLRRLHLKIRHRAGEQFQERVEAARTRSVERARRSEPMPEANKDKWEIIKDAAKAYPPVKLAMGLVGIGLAVALVYGAVFGNVRVATIGTLFAIVLLPVLFLFKLYISHHGGRKALPMSAVVLVNFCVYFTIALMILFCLCTFFGVPEFGAKLIYGK